MAEPLAREAAAAEPEWGSDQSFSPANQSLDLVFPIVLKQKFPVQLCHCFNK